MPHKSPANERLAHPGGLKGFNFIYTLPDIITECHYRQRQWWLDREMENKTTKTFLSSLSLHLFYHIHIMVNAIRSVDFYVDAVSLQCNRDTVCVVCLRMQQCHDDGIPSTLCRHIKLFNCARKLIWMSYNLLCMQHCRGGAPPSSIWSTLLLCFCAFRNGILYHPPTT